MIIFRDISTAPDFLLPLRFLVSPYNSFFIFFSLFFPFDFLSFLFLKVHYMDYNFPSSSLVVLPSAPPHPTLLVVHPSRLVLLPSSVQSSRPSPLYSTSNSQLSPPPPPQIILITTTPVQTYHYPHLEILLNDHQPLYTHILRRPPSSSTSYHRSCLNVLYTHHLQSQFLPSSNTDTLTHRLE